MEDATNEPFLTKSNVRACGESGKPASNRRKEPSQTREGVESPMDTGVQDAPDPGTSRHIQCRKTQCFPRSRAGSNPVGDATKFFSESGRFQDEYPLVASAASDEL